MCKCQSLRASHDSLCHETNAFNHVSRHYTQASFQIITYFRVKIINLTQNRMEISRLHKEVQRLELGMEMESGYNECLNERSNILVLGSDVTHKL